jgi:hypothetical protein
MRSRIRYPTNFQIPTLSTFWGFRQAQAASVILAVGRRRWLFIGHPDAGWPALSFTHGIFHAEINVAMRSLASRFVVFSGLRPAEAPPSRSSNAAQFTDTLQA